MNATRTHISPRRQRGAATLIVVMLLFFIISMVAAYTSRNLIFEQRTSANQYRSTMAFEAAEAGIEWALAQLNAGRTTNACAASTDANDKSFAQRYLGINPTTGQITPVPPTGGGSVQAQCVFDTSNASAANWAWKCNCPVANAATAALVAPSGGNGPAPSFLINFSSSAQVGPRTDLVQLEANSCTRMDAACLTFATEDRGGTGDGVARTGVLLALRGAITRPPAAALTVAGTLSGPPGGATLTLSNEEAGASGVTLHTGGAAPASAITKRTIAGTPPDASVLSTDASLTPAAAGTYTAPDRRFAMYFGVRPDTYFRQAGMVVVDCSAGCDASSVNQALQRNPGRAIHVMGAGTLSINADIGAVGPPLVPALLIVDGDVTFASGVNFVGLLYGRSAAWTVTVDGAANIRGAVVAEGNLTLAGAGGAAAITYHSPTLTALRVSYGTFVRVPGSWQDFR